MDKNKLKGIIEALIFASDSPLSINQMKAILEDVDKADIEAAIEHLAHDLEGRSIFLKKVSGGYQFATRPEFSRWVKQMFIGRERNRLTRAALETLAIIAFKQPISRVEVSAIRGVNCDGVIKNLLERKLITITGRDEGQGRALLFSTTKEFLQYFGINELADLPKPKEIEELLAQGEGENAIKEISEEEILLEDEQVLDEEELEKAAFPVDQPAAETKPLPEEPTDGSQEIAVETQETLAESADVVAPGSEEPVSVAPQMQPHDGLSGEANEDAH